MLKPIKFVTRRNIVLLICSTLLASCGGGGGRSASDNDNNNTDGGTNAPLSDSFDCIKTLTQSTVDSTTSSSIPNLGNGCDYLVNESLTFPKTTVIEAGVTFALDDGVELDFQSDTLTAQGTAQFPIIFQAKSSDRPWRTITFDNKELTLSGVQFFDGGKSDGSGEYDTASYSEAAVVVNNSGSGSGNSEITNSTFSNSHSAGLLIDTRSLLNTFSGNRFDGNKLYSLILQSPSRLDFISTLDSNTFTNRTDQPLLISDGKFRSDKIEFKNVGVPFMFVNTNRNNFFRASLLFKKGSELWFGENSGIEDATIYALGTEDDPVVFKGLPGNESNWGGLSIGDTSVLRYFKIIGGGSGSATRGASLALTRGSGGNVRSLSGKYIVEHGSIEHSQGTAISCPDDGIYSENIVDVTFTGSVFGDIDPGCGIDLLANQGISQSADTPDYTFAEEQCTNILFESNVSTPIILKNTDSPCDYLVVGENKLSSNVSIEAGTTLIFERAASLSVGTMQAEGTNTALITMRGVEPAAGYWVGLEISGNSSRLDYVSIQDAGWLNRDYYSSSRTPLADGMNSNAAALHVGGLENSLNNLKIVRSTATGIDIRPDATLFAFENNTIESVGTFAVFADTEHAVSIAKGLIVSDDDPGLFENGVLLSNWGRSLYKTSFSDVNRLYLSGEEELTLSKLDVPWYITELGIRNNGKLTLGPGTDLRVFNSINLNPGTQGAATFRIAGTEAETVSIKGFNDEQITLNWRGVFTGNSGDVDLQFDYLKMEGAISGLYLGSIGGEVAISNSTIKNGENGIRCGRFTTANISLTNVVFEGITDTEVSSDCPAI